MRPGKAWKNTGSSRDLLNHNPGKGSAPRFKYNEHWRQNYDSIDWTTTPTNTNQPTNKPKPTKHLAEQFDIPLPDVLPSGQ